MNKPISKIDLAAQKITDAVEAAKRAAYDRAMVGGTNNKATIGDRTSAADDGDNSFGNLRTAIKDWATVSIEKK